MYLKHNNVVIRNAEVNDIDILASWWADGKVMAHAGFPNGIKTDKSKLTDRIKAQNGQSLPKNQLLIIDLGDGDSIGEMNYREKSKGVFEIGIKICTIKEQGKGYGSIAIKLLITFLKNELKAKKIVLDTNLNNFGAQRFYKRLGFKQVDVKEDFWRDQNGNMQTAVFFEMPL